MAIQQPPYWRKAFIFLAQVLLGISLSWFLGMSWSDRTPGSESGGVAIAALTSRQSAPSEATDREQRLQQGRSLYQAGRFSEAATLWQGAAEAYQAEGDIPHQALALSYLSLAYQQLGQLSEAKQASATSLALIQKSGQSGQHNPILAQILNAQGSLQLAQGQAEQALATWQQAATAYTKAGDDQGRIGSLINQAQALQSLGFYLQARKTLTEVEQVLLQQSDPGIQATGLQSLGDILRVVGDFNGSQRVLEQGLALARQANLKPVQSDLWLSLGNTARARQDWNTALQDYQQAATLAVSPAAKLRSQLNQLSVLLDGKRWAEAQALQLTLKPQVTALPLSQAAVYAQINFVQSLMRLQSQSLAGVPNWSESAAIAATAVQQAQQLGDPRAQAYALGHLAKLYEKTQQWSEAQALTRKALVLAQAINASDITYQWQWQLGRLLRVQAAQEGTHSAAYTGAIAAYTDAVSTLRTLRNDLVAINPDVQFSFRESVEPVYRQLVGLLLQPDASTDASEVSQRHLKQAREVIESLQLAQLENFFQAACLNARPAQIDRVDPTAAVFYSIILEDRLEVILSLPNQPLRHYAALRSEEEIESQLDKTRQLLRRTSLDEERLQASQQMYDLLLRPAESALAASGVKTLVFVLDGALQNIPMSILYDGQQYLLEKYSLALAPGLQLLEPQPLEREKLKVLVGALSEASQGFSALPGVETEVQQITSEIPTQVLLNQAFTSATLQRQTENATFPVVHLATHGQFSSNARDTFILAWDSPINVKQLDELLRAREQTNRRPIELLVLSACQTALGDRRAALGLAGVAVRSGARSTLATLWPVDDQSTAFLMVHFYQGLTQGKLTKAEALRRAQLELQKQPEFSHPYYWAPFVLVGNWL